MGALPEQLPVQRGELGRRRVRVAAEGFRPGNGTHEAVYHQALFNLRKEKGQYRFAEGDSCPVCEAIVPKTLGIAHQVLAERKTVEKIAEIMHKVTSNVDELRKYMKMK